MNSDHPDHPPARATATGVLTALALITLPLALITGPLGLIVPGALGLLALLNATDKRTGHL